MKLKHVGIIFRDLGQRKVAGNARLGKEEDKGVTTQEQADNYRGPEFTLGESCFDLDVEVSNGCFLVCVQEEEYGGIVSYWYPLDTIARIKTVTTEEY